MRIKVSVLGFLISNCFMGGSARAYDSSKTQQGIRWIENTSRVRNEDQDDSANINGESEFDFDRLSSDCGTKIQCGKDVYSCCPGDHYIINNCNGYTVKCN